MKKHVSLVLAFAMCLSLCACREGGTNNLPSDTTSTQQAETLVDYTLTIKNSATYPLKNVMFTISSINGQTVFEGITDECGKATVLLDKSSEFYIQLTNVPAGYLNEDKYYFKDQQCDIVLSSQVIPESVPNGTKYELGDIVHDFTVITTEEEKFTLSEVLQEKSAVMIAFFWSGDPRNLPIINAAFPAYEKDIAVLAVESFSGEDDAINAKNEYSLAFDVTHHIDLNRVFGGQNTYPCEVIIDKSGILCLRSWGAGRTENTYKNAFKYFSADNYTQKLFNDLDEIPQGFSPEECPGHSIVSREIIAEATCTTAGTHKGYCKYCSTEMEEEYYAQHNYSFGVCVVCGKLENEE